MYRVTKRIEIAGAHRLKLPYPSKCSVLHGHNWIVTVTARCHRLDDNGMVMDFGEIANVVRSFDHEDLNEHLPDDMNPTAENLAQWIFQLIMEGYDADTCARREFRVESVTVQESEGNVACYFV